MSKPMAIFYEHPEWFKPLFAQLETRGVPHEHVLAHKHQFDPDSTEEPYSIVFNRVSPSSYLRGHTSAIFYTLQYLQHLENLDVPVINGFRAHLHEISKARQLGLLKRLGVPHPRSLVVNAPTQIEGAAAELEYPVIIKPNIGGSGALMTVFEHPNELREAVAAGALDEVFTLDATAIVQEYHPAVNDTVTRVEALNGEILYGIDIKNDPTLGFNLCPADLEQREEPNEAATGDACVTQARYVERAEPPDDVLEATLRIFHEADITVGGLEYLISKRDGTIYVYDVNAVSNFVGNAPEVVGFDPFENLADYLEQRYYLATRELAGAGAR